MEAVMECEPDVIFIGGRLGSIYDELSKIAPVYQIKTDVSAGLVQSTAENALAIASLFGEQGQIEALVSDYADRIAALQAVAEGKTAIVGMVNAGGFSLLGNDGRCSLIGREIGFENVGVDADTDTSAHGNEATRPPLSSCWTKTPTTSLPWTGTLPSARRAPSWPQRCWTTN